MGIDEREREREREMKKKKKRTSRIMLSFVRSRSTNRRERKW